MVTVTSWLTLFLAIILSFHPSNGIAATAASAYVHSTERLDLNQVRFAVSAPPDITAPLFERASSLFAKAGLPLANSDSSRKPFIATLTLTLDPRPLPDTCPGQVLYTPSLALTEQVIIIRNSAVINDVTWFASTGTQVREALTPLDLERDLDGLVQQFINDYGAANAGRRSSPPGNTSATEHPDTASDRPVPADLNGRQIDLGLNALHAEKLEISVLAGQFTGLLKTRARQQFSTAGLSLSPGQRNSDHPTLDIELVQQSLEDRCPGKVLYEPGLYLVERVQIRRNPHVSLWSDTWMRETTQIVAPRSREELESDQDALLRQFIELLKTH
ncbi:MAG: hypothetical protein ABL970_18090 [Nitrospira sp.]